MADRVVGTRSVITGNVAPVAPVDPVPAPASLVQTSGYDGVTRGTSARATTLPDAKGADREVARIGATVITARDVDAELASIDAEQELGSLVDAFAAPLGLTRGAAETLDDFIDRVSGRMRAANSTDAERAMFMSQVATSKSLAREDALGRLVEHATLLQLAGGDDETGPISERNEALRARAEAALVKSGRANSPAKARPIINAEIGRHTMAAIAGPHARQLASALPDFAPAARQSFDAWLTETYRAVHGEQAGAVIASELENKGDAARVASLVEATGKLEWTVADLSAAAQRAPALQPFVERLLGSTDVWRDGGNTVQLVATPSGLTAKIDDQPALSDARAAIMQRMRTGETRLTWAPMGLAVGLTLADKDGASPAAQTLATQLSAAIEAEGATLGSQLRGGARSGVSDLLPPQELQRLARESPAGIHSLKYAAFDSALDGEKPAVITAQAARVGASNDQARELATVQTRVRVMLGAHALPKALSPGGAGITLPLDTSATLDSAQQDAIASVQAYAVQSGGLGDVTSGKLDDRTLSLLKRMAKPGDTSVTLTPEIMRGYVTQLANAGSFKSAPVADLILSHPAVIRERQAGGKTDAVQLVTAYMREQGLLSENDRPGTPGFVAALDKSNSRPLDEALLAKARDHAARIPVVSGERLETLLSAIATRGNGATPAYALSAPDTEARVETRQHLAALGSQSTRSIDRGELDQLAVREPIAALRLARAELLHLQSPLDGASGIDSALTADELRDLHALAFAADKGAHDETWHRVIDGVRRGDIKIASLTSPPTDGPLRDDVATVFADLRGMAAAVRATTMPSAATGPNASTLRRVGAELYRLGTHPVDFSNPMVTNDVRDWQVLAVRAEMQRAGVGAPIAGIGDLQRSALNKVDADFIDFLLRNHPDAFGRSHLDTLLRGFPNELPSADAAIDLLKQTSAAMRAGTTPPWQSLNIGIGDIDARTRTAKLLVQAALRATNGGASDASILRAADARAFDDTLSQMLGQSRSDVVPDANALLIQRGAVGIEALRGDLRSPTFDAARLSALADIGRKTAAEIRASAPKSADEIMEAVATIERLAKAGGPASMEPMSPLGIAASKIVVAARAGQNTVHGVGMVDFAAQLGNAQTLTVRGGVDNNVDASGSITELFQRARLAASADAENARVDAAWRSDRRFDPSVALQTGVATPALLYFVMRRMLEWDLTVAPFLGTKHAVSMWLTTDDPTVRAAAMADLGKTWSNVGNTLATTAASMNPVAYAAELKQQWDTGHLDVLAGELPSYAAIMGLTSMGAYRLGRGIVRGATAMGNRLMSGAPGPANIVFAEPVAVTAEAGSASAVSLMRRTAGGAYAAATTAADAVTAPLTTLTGGLRAARDTVGRRFLRVAPVAQGVALPPAIADWIARAPDDVLNLVVTNERGTHIVPVSNRDLLAARDARDLPNGLARQLRGQGLGSLEPQLNAIARSIPQVTTATPVGPRASVMQMGLRPDEQRRWTLRGATGGSTELTLNNRQTLQLLRESNNQVAFQKLLATFGLEGKEAEVRSVLATFDRRSAFTLNAANRLATAVAAPTRLRDLAERMRQPRNEDANAAPAANAQGNTATASTTAAPGTPNIDQRLSALRGELTAWAQREAAGEITGAAIAEHAEWLAQTRAELGAMSSQGGATRTALASLRAQVAVRAAVTRLRTAGVTNVAGSIVRGSLRNMAGAARGSGLFFILAAGGYQVAVDLGPTLNDESATRIDKTVAGAEALLHAGVTMGGTALAYGTLRAVAPRVATGLGVAGFGAMLAQAASDPVGLIEPFVAPFVGLKGPVESMQHWQELGVPEAGFLRIDAERDKRAPFGTADLEMLGNNYETPRTAYWYYDESSPLHERLSQLLPQSGGGSPVRRPRAIDPFAVKQYHEPTFPTVDFVEALPTLRDRFSGLNSLDDVRGFSVDAFRRSAQADAHAAVNRVTLDDGRKLYDIDEAALRQALAQYDRYGQLSEPQRAALQRRNDMTIRQARRWATVVSLMNISDGDKEAALTQMVKNYIATYYANSIMYRFGPTYQSTRRDSGHWGTHPIGLPNADTNIDDFYTASAQLMRDAKLTRR